MAVQRVYIAKFGKSLLKFSVFSFFAGLPCLCMDISMDIVTIRTSTTCKLIIDTILDHYVYNVTGDNSYK